MQSAIARPNLSEVGPSYPPAERGTRFAADRNLLYFDQPESVSALIPSSSVVSLNRIHYDIFGVLLFDDNLALLITIPLQGARQVSPERASLSPITYLLLFVLRRLLPEISMAQEHGSHTNLITDTLAQEGPPAGGIVHPPSPREPEGVNGQGQ